MIVAMVRGRRRVRIDKKMDVFFRGGFDGMEPGLCGVDVVVGMRTGVVVVMKRRKRGGAEFSDCEGVGFRSRRSGQSDHNDIIACPSTERIEKLQLQQIHLSQFSVRRARNRSGFKRVRQSNLLVLTRSGVSEGRELQG